MKYNLQFNKSDLNKEYRTLIKRSSKRINIDSLPNKLLNDMIDSYIKNKVSFSNSNKKNNFYLTKNIKSPVILAYNKRINSAKIIKYFSPKSDFKSIECEKKKENETFSFKHKNYSAINISDDCYNFHKNEPKKVINKEKRLFIYINKDNEKIKEDNEDEKCNISPKYYISEYQKQGIINNKSNFRLGNLKNNSESFQKNKLFQTPNKFDKSFRVILQHSNSVKNNAKISDKKINQLEKLTSLIKDQVKDYFIKHRFSSIKDYFNDWLYFKRKKDYQKKIYLDEDSIYNYLKEKIGVKIYKNEIQKIFKCNKVFFDINNFKNFFFEENSGRKLLNINDSLLFKPTLFNSYKKFKKNKNIFSSFSDIIKSTKDKMPNFKNNLLMTVLKEHKSKIVDQISSNFILNHNKNEYDYFDFYNLFQNLNIDKKIINKKVIRRVFDKYKNKNDKINIKYFIYNLYSDDSIKKEIFCSKEEDKKESNQIINKNYYNSKPINLHLNKIEFPSNNKSQNKIHLIKTIKQNSNSNINDNKQLTKDKEIEKYNFKSATPSIKNESIFNNKINNNTANVTKFIKFSASKVCRKLKKKKLFNLYDSSLKSSNNLTSIIKTNKQKTLDVNNYKTIRISKKYNSNTNNNNNITTKDNNDSSAKKPNLMERPISAYSKCLLGINNYYRNNSFVPSNETMKFIHDDSRIQKLNSDIINLI